jgi:hypothetical protein
MGLIRLIKIKWVMLELTYIVLKTHVSTRFELNMRMRIVTPI